MPRFKKKASPKLKTTPNKAKLTTSTPTKVATSNSKRTRSALSAIKEKSATNSPRKSTRISTPSKNDNQKNNSNKQKKHISFSEIDISPVKPPTTNKILDQFFLIETEVKNQIDHYEPPSKEFKEFSFIVASPKFNGTQPPAMSSTPLKSASKKNFQDYLQSIDRDISNIENSSISLNGELRNNDQDEEHKGTPPKRSSARLRNLPKNKIIESPTKKPKNNKILTSSPLKTKNANKINNNQSNKPLNNKKTNGKIENKKPGRRAKVHVQLDENLEKQRQDFFKRLETFTLAEEVL